MSDSTYVDASKYGQISGDYPFLPKQAPVRGALMSYIDEGQGDPVLLLHGNGTWSYLWRNVIPHLRDLSRIVAPDLIGMGRSEKPQLSYGFFDHAGYLEELILLLDLRNITLVVHDWGSGLGCVSAWGLDLDRRGVRSIRFNTISDLKGSRRRR